MNGGHPIGGTPIGSQLAYYKFDEQHGQTTNNSGNGGSTYNGTLGADTSSVRMTRPGKQTLIVK